MILSRSQPPAVKNLRRTEELKVGFSFSFPIFNTGTISACGEVNGEFVARMISGKEKMAAMERRDDLFCVFFGVIFFFFAVMFSMLF